MHVVVKSLPDFEECRWLLGNSAFSRSSLLSERRGTLYQIKIHAVCGWIRAQYIRGTNPDHNDVTMMPDIFNLKLIILHN